MGVFVPVWLQIRVCLICVISTSPSGAVQIQVGLELAEIGMLTKTSKTIGTGNLATGGIIPFRLTASVNSVNEGLLVGGRGGTMGSAVYQTKKAYYNK